MKQILKNGAVTEVADDYELKRGESWVEVTAGGDGFPEFGKTSLGADEEGDANARTSISGGQTEVPLNVEFKVLGAQRTYPTINGEKRLVYQLELGFKDGSRIVVPSTTFTRTLRNLVTKDGVNATASISPRSLRPEGETRILIGQIWTGANSGADVMKKCNGHVFMGLADDRRLCHFDNGDSEQYTCCAVCVR